MTKRKVVKRQKPKTSSIRIFPSMEPELFITRLKTRMDHLGPRFLEHGILLSLHMTYTRAQVSISRAGKIAEHEANCADLEGRTSVLVWLDALADGLGVFHKPKPINR